MINNFAIFVLVLSVSCSAFCGSLRTGKRTRSAEEVSMIELIAAPSEYAEKKVSLYGALSCGGGECQVFLGVEAFENFDFSNSILLKNGDLDEFLSLHEKELRGAKAPVHILVQGVFHYEEDHPNKRRRKWIAPTYLEAYYDE